MPYIHNALNVRIFYNQKKVSSILAEPDYRSSERGTCQREKFEQQVTEGAGDGSGFYEAQVN